MGIKYDNHNYYGLAITVEPEEKGIGTSEKPFLTGSSIIFLVHVKNIIHKRYRGKIAIRFIYQQTGQSVVSKCYPFRIDLPPFGSISYRILEDHEIEGLVKVELCLLGNPKFKFLKSLERLEIDGRISNGSIIYSYKVIDRVSYEIETKRFNEFAKQLEASLTTHVEQAILARLGQHGLGSLKSKVAEEQAIVEPEPKKRRDDYPYIM